MSVLKCDQEGGVGVVRRGAWEEGAGHGSCSTAVAHRCSPSVSVSPGRHLHCTIISDYFKHTWLKQFCGWQQEEFFFFCAALRAWGAGRDLAGLLGHRQVPLRREEMEVPFTQYEGPGGLCHTGFRRVGQHIYCFTIQIGALTGVRSFTWGSHWSEKFRCLTSALIPAPENCGDGWC